MSSVSEVSDQTAAEVFERAGAANGFICKYGFPNRAVSTFESVMAFRLVTARTIAVIIAAVAVRAVPRIECVAR
jgi:hypothetical protein